MRGKSKQQNNNTMYLLGQIPYPYSIAYLGNDFRTFQ